MLEYNQSVTDLLTKHSVKLGQGLTTKKAASLVEKFGLNKLTIKTDALWRKLLEPFLDVFMLVLIVAGLISIVQHHVVDFVIIMIIIAINAAIYYIQQFSTSRILRSLRKQTQQMVKAWRNGQKTTIGIEQLVPGDIIALNEGDRVPADGRVVELSNLKIDEAILTGESEPIVKSINALRGSREVYDRTNMVFAGTFVITGTATVLVTNTGNNTEYGRIAKLASNVTILSPVQVKINKLVTQIAIVVGIISLVTLVIAIYQGIPFLNSLQFVVAMAVSAVPEGMPVAISIILALGMRRMAAKKALVTNMR
ncbi:HAD-IC family P-type ATPase, partial [Candidatus Saccharibacteria bacterium]|nr:HAD-IC family P-type ATPase [Candidatus Saccharibacteria bacterium]